jgi:Protein of unknown function (DUF3606)
MRPAKERIKWATNSKTVDIRNPDALTFWTKRFHVSACRLKKVVQMVGPRFKDVATFLHRLQRI